MRYSFKDVVNSRSDSKKKIDQMDVWVYFLVRPFANVLTMPFIWLNCSANFATLVSTAIGMLGAVLLFIAKDFWSTLIALIILNLWIVFDCIDGNIARTTRNTSRTGEFFDGISGYIFMVSLYVSMGFNVATNYNATYSKWYTLIGGLTALATVVPRLIEHKAETMFANYNSGVSDKFSYSMFYKIGLNIAGPAGLSNPFMIIAHLLGYLNYYLVLYFVVQSGIAMLSIFKTLKKVLASSTKLHAD